MSGSSLLVSGVAPDQAGGEDSLSLSVWEVYSDAVILDWYITLSMKFRSVKYSRQTVLSRPYHGRKDRYCLSPQVVQRDTTRLRTAQMSKVGVSIFFVYHRTI